jgi:hypothetical protein
MGSNSDHDYLRNNVCYGGEIMTEEEWDTVILPKEIIASFVNNESNLRIIELWRQSLKQAYLGGELSIQGQLIRVLNLRHLLGVK